MLNKKAHVILVIILAVILQSFFPIYVNAKVSGGQGKTVKVAYPIVRGYSMIDETGKRSGMFYDFLVEIAKYTGWKYEFIDGDVMELNKEVADGGIDLMGGTFYREYLLEDVVYPEYDIGDTYALLLADNDDQRLNPYNLQTMNGKTIGVFAEETDKIIKLNKYLDFNQLSCKLLYFDDSQEYENSLDDKKVDILLGGDIQKKDNHKVIGKFISEPSYIVVSKKSGELINELNEGLRQVYEANPNFAEFLYNQYFPEVYKTQFLLNEEDKSYIAGNPTVRVAMMKERYPLNYQYQKEQKGILKDILSSIGEKTGFEFEYVYADTYLEAIELVQNGQADIVGYFLDDQETAEELGLMTTAPYTSLDEIIIRNKKVQIDSEDLCVAMPKGRSVAAAIQEHQVIYYPTYAECLKKIDLGEVDTTYIPFAFAEDLFQRNYYSNLVILPVNDKKLDVSLAVPNIGYSHLYYILSKAINTMDDSELVHIVADNQKFISDNKVTVRSLIYSNPLLAILICLFFAISVTSIVLIRWRYKMKSELMTGELKQMEAASAAKLDFLSRMSHELRTPMNAIIGLTKLAKLSGEATPPLEDKLEKIDSSSQYLLSLLNDILDMSKIESSKMKIITNPFRIKDLADELEYMMRLQAEEKGLNFEVICDTGETVYIADMLRIKQVLTNLLSNAFKFTDKGGTVKLEAQENKEAGDFAMVSFSVQDTGIGIRKEDIKKIFGVFEQVTDSGISTKGTGLGLAISSNLVRLMGGELQVESQEGKGSKFYFSLIFPYGRIVEEDNKQNSALLKGEDKVLKGMKLLLAEDNALNAEITIALLEQKEIEVEHVINGQEAVNIFVGRPAGYYQAILMDIQMPVMNGFTATKLIRESSKKDSATIPIIAMTANTFQEDRDQAAASGMTDFIPKPFKIEELYQILSK